MASTWSRSSRDRVWAWPSSSSPEAGRRRAFRRPHGGSKPADLKAQFLNASVLKDGRAVFNVAGNKYRLVAWINYPYRVVYVRFVGTHREYDAIDAQEV